MERRLEDSSLLSVQPMGADDESVSDQLACSLEERSAFVEHVIFLQVLAGEFRTAHHQHSGWPYSDLHMVAVGRE
ncbi:hypothetical protein GCM10022403_037810 [Streptomyces coacervatus]|uniref:Uncharacterized protein n=1 Tax=Streptomyces coacervatus TaxID=647381 RepID=A0ABP7HRT6_9ACTN